MPAPSKTWTAIADAAVAAGKPLDEPLLTALRDNLVHLEEWLGHSYAAAQDHNHDGVNSALISVGPNMLRNYGFEEDLTGWSSSLYSGGSVAISSSNDMEGGKAVGITSANVANGGGYVQTGTVPVGGGVPYRFSVLAKASVPNVSSDAVVIWYNKSLVQISTSQIFVSTSTPTSAALYERVVMAPAAARYALVRLTGGVPGSGSSAGTVYFDHAFMGLGFDRFMAAGEFRLANIGSALTWGSPTDTKVAEFVVPYTGLVRVKFDLWQSGGGTVGGRLRINGVVAGTDRQTASGSATTYTEDIPVTMGDQLQLYLRQVAGSPVANATNFGVYGAMPAGVFQTQP